ncbi:hypothetical protein [Streptomyces sp. ST2-7A]|uniref:hypothetical protein n=1 Tax=Streptomyces sp. ST2-7A TaxID=2907214 RepID=UPI001F1A1CF0|nr:hypothetical protein [Streptomyces sp. ST2-7A]MCE7081195.1 hypothetical protein [Streptomyces sp. ST2-7A]
MATTPRGAFTGRPCRSCGTRIRARLYLCATCWDRLPANSRRALSHRGPTAMRRLRALYDRIDEGWPLEEITIT